MNVPVKLFTATEDHSVSFRQFEPETGERIRYQRVTERSGKEVEYADIVKGYELEDGNFVLITPEELEAVEPGKSRTIDIEDFIDLDAVDPVYFDKTYHLAPADESSPAWPPAAARRAWQPSVSEARQKRDDRGRASSEPTPPDGRFADMSKDELYEEAKRRDIEGRSSMSKDELVAALSSRLAAAS